MSTNQHHEIFGIPEILEAILLNIDIRDLLVSAQRICKHWRELVATSPRLQQRLFIAPDFTGPRKINPLLQEAFPFCFPDPENERGSRVYAKSEHCDLDGMFREHRHIRAAHIFQRSLAFGRPQASWRQMLIQQPPLWEIGDLVTIEPDQRVLLCRSRTSAPQVVAGRFLPAYVRMPDILGLALASMKLSIAGRPEEPVAVMFRVLWNQPPRRIANYSMASLVETMVSEYGVVVQNIGIVKTSRPLKKVSGLRAILLEDLDGIGATV